MQSAVLSSGAFLGIVLLLTLSNKADSNPLLNQEELLNTVDDDGEIRIRNPYLFELLADLEQDLIARKENPDSFSKRGLDFGVSRGYSGAEAAKHRLGLAAAKNPHGPGRKRRSLTYLS